VTPDEIEAPLRLAEDARTFGECSCGPSRVALADAVVELAAECERLRGESDLVLQEWSNVKALIEGLKQDEPTIRDLIEVVEQWAKTGKARYCSWCLDFTAVTNEELREHMLTCEGHPMRELAKERDAAIAERDALAAAVTKLQVRNEKDRAERDRLQNTIDQILERIATADPWDRLGSIRAYIDDGAGGETTKYLVTYAREATGKEPVDG